MEDHLVTGMSDDQSRPLAWQPPGGVGEVF
jgi:hypothetical protein